MSLLDRRSLVRLAIAGLVSVGAMLLFAVGGRVTPARANLTDGDVVLGGFPVGGSCTPGSDPNCSNDVTKILNPSTGNAFLGYAADGVGVTGYSPSGTGVLGSSNGSGDGVFAENTGVPDANGGAFGLFALSDNATGGHIETESQYGAGLEVAVNNTGNLRGAIETQTSGYGPALQATSAHGPSVEAVGGHSLALLAQGSSRFTGKTTFARSGKLTVASGASTSKKTNVSLGSASLVLATIQGNAPGVWVQGVTLVPGSTGSFTVHLNTNAPSSLTVAWFIVN